MRNYMKGVVDILEDSAPPAPIQFHILDLTYVRTYVRIVCSIVLELSSEAAKQNKYVLYTKSFQYTLYATYLSCVVRDKYAARGMQVQYKYSIYSTELLTSPSLFFYTIYI